MAVRSFAFLSSFTFIHSLIHRTPTRLFKICFKRADRLCVYVLYTHNIRPPLFLLLISIPLPLSVFHSLTRYCTVRGEICEGMKSKKGEGSRSVYPFRSLLLLLLLYVCRVEANLRSCSCHYTRQAGRRHLHTERKRVRVRERHNLNRRRTASIDCPSSSFFFFTY